MLMLDEKKSSVEDFAFERIRWERCGATLICVDECKELCLGTKFDTISRVAGIEPTQSVLKTDVLPLNYTPL